MVLGGDGFIGSHLCQALATAEHSARAFGQFEGRPPRNLPASDPSVDVVDGDFFDKGPLSRAIQGASHVFHLVSTTTPRKLG